MCFLLCEQLQAEHRVHRISLTHSCAKLLGEGAVTVQAFLHRHVLHSNLEECWVYIDECSLLGTSLLSYLAILTQHPGIQFLISGDFNQLGAPADCWSGSLIENNNFQYSRLLHTMCGGNCIKLTQSRRSDSALFSFYSSLMNGPLMQAPLSDCSGEVCNHNRWYAPESCLASTKCQCFT